MYFVGSHRNCLGEVIPMSTYKISKKKKKKKKNKKRKKSDFCLNLELCRIEPSLFDVNTKLKLQILQTRIRRNMSLEDDHEKC